MSDVAKYQELLVGPIERFDQMNTMFKRAVFDPVWVERSRVLYEPTSAQNRAGYTPEDYALRIAAGCVKKVFSMGKEISSMIRRESGFWLATTDGLSTPGSKNT